jgi:hypothetical protein
MVVDIYVLYVEFCCGFAPTHFRLKKKKKLFFVLGLKKSF